MEALVFGSLNIDHVYKMNHFVQPGETISSEDLQLFCGGKGLNQSVALARSGVETWHAGAVGLNDSDMLIKQLQEAEVRTELIRKKEGPSGHAVIQTTPEGENSIILYGGANQKITEEEVDCALSHFTRGDVLVLQNEINQIPYIMEKAYGIGMTIVLNPSPMDEKIFHMPLSFVDYFILNEVEGAIMSGVSHKDSQEILEALMKRFPNSRIVLTLGKEGAVYGDRKKRCYQPIYPVKTVDTTAAGDTFTGFFMGSVIQGMSVEEALDTAALASSMAVSRKGASPSIPTWGEVSEWRKDKR